MFRDYFCKILFRRVRGVLRPKTTRYNRYIVMAWISAIWPTPTRWSTDSSAANTLTLITPKSVKLLNYRLTSETVIVKSWNETSDPRRQAVEMYASAAKVHLVLLWPWPLTFVRVPTIFWYWNSRTFQGLSTFKDPEVAFSRSNSWRKFTAWTVLQQYLIFIYVITGQF